MAQKLFKGLFPFFSVFIIFLGFLKTIIYYGHFGVNINDFIALNEIVVLFFDDIILGFLAVMLPLFFLLVIINNDTRENDEKSNWPLVPVKKELKTFIIALNGIIFFCFAAISLVYYVQDYSRRIILGTISITIMYCFCVWFLQLVFQRIFNRNIHRLYYRIVISFYLIVLAVVASSLESAHKTMKGKYVGTQVYTTDSVYTSTINNFYIGKTENYVFLYDKNLKIATALPNLEVKKLGIKKQR
jgi:hypothetical protein